MPDHIHMVDFSAGFRPTRSLPRAGPSSKVQRRKARPSVPVPDVIEITDSEDEAGPSIGRGPGITISSSSLVEIDAPLPQPASSPVSRLQQEQPLFLPEPDEFVAGPSGSPKRSASPATPPPPSRAPTRVFEDGFGTDISADVFDPVSSFLAQVLEIVPDVEPDHAVNLITLHMDANKDSVLETVLHTLFENSDYPRVDRKGKRKREEDQRESASVSRRRLSDVQVDYADEARPRPPGLHYEDLAATRLHMDFPSMPAQYIRRAFRKHNCLYAPTHIALDAELATGRVSYKPLQAPRTEARLRKGKGVQRDDPDFDLELEYIRQRRTRADEGLAVQLRKETSVELEATGIECGCCFTENAFDDMIQCPDAHLFCKTCMTAYASTKLGEQDANLVCMDQSDCKLPFSDSELGRLLTPQLLSLYERIKQRKEIEAAGLENLAECPFCEYKVVIENETERLFRCESAACGAVSCRACKKLDHLPKSCKEAEDDSKLDARHTVEEAMTAALMRNCPKCAKAFLKESGCNKMTCPGCHTLSCYVCRKIITGYDHFNQAPPYTQVADNTKCPLWDQVEQRHANEVAAAAKKAIEQVKLAHPHVNDQDIHVDLPQAPAAPAAPRPHGIVPLPAAPRAAAAAGPPQHQYQGRRNIDGFENALQQQRMRAQVADPALHLMAEAFGARAAVQVPLHPPHFPRAPPVPPVLNAPPAPARAPPQHHQDRLARALQQQQQQQMQQMQAQRGRIEQEARALAVEHYALHQAQQARVQMQAQMAGRQQAQAQARAQQHMQVQARARAASKP